ncbi:MAG: DUF3822 family protein [Ferruginibacter sp.]
MNLSFYIQPANINTSNAELFLEINSQGLSYTILDKNVFVALASYHFDTAISDEVAAGNIHKIMAAQPVLKQKFNKVHIIYGYTASMLIPEAYMDEKNSTAMLELVYGEASERVVRTDFVDEHAIYNVYGVPAEIEQVLNRYFGSAKHTHVFSLLPAVFKGNENYMYCIFGKGQLKVLLVKEGKLQLMQSVTYKTPDDIVYHLLNLYKNFEIAMPAITIYLSGMIDPDSALYTEVYKYFLQLEFQPLPEQYQYPDEINQYPAHYFSHLFAIAACV